MATWPAKTNYATGDVLTAAQMNDIGGELNDLYTTAGKAAGKNKIINGDFGIWQRGTSFSTVATYTADRWYMIWDGTGATRTITRETFTPGTAPVAGYEGTYFYRYNQSVAGTGGTYSVLTQRIEDVRTLAGQTVTISFWAKSSGTTAFTANLEQNFGSGGSSTITITPIGSTATTTGWVRYSGTGTLGSMSGKTIGTNSYLAVTLGLPINSTFTLDFWGFQLEAGSTATQFQTATGTIQGELAACQRYYYRQTSGTAYGLLGLGTTYSSTIALIGITPPVTMRIIPTAIESSTLSVNDSVTRTAVTSATLAGSTTPNYLVLNANVASGLTGYRPIFLETNNSATGYVAFTAEL